MTSSPVAAEHQPRRASAPGGPAPPGRPTRRPAPSARRRPAPGRSARPSRRPAASPDAGAGRRPPRRSRAAPAESTSRTANAWSDAGRPAARSARRGRSRRGSASRSDRALSRPVVWHSASQRTPSRVLEPEHPVEPGPERVGVDHDRRPAAGGDLARARRRSVVAPAPPEPPTTPTRHARRGRSVAEVGEQLDQPRLRTRAARRRSRHRAPARRGHRARPGTGPRPRRGRRRGASAASSASSAPRRRRRAPAARRPSRPAPPRPSGAHDLGRHAGRRGEPQQLVEQRRRRG